MNEHVKVIDETLTRLYQRIETPSGSDALRLRVARKALAHLADAEEEPSALDLTGMNVAQVQAAVEAGRISARDALTQETNGAKRKTLAAWLDERIG